MKRTTVSMYSHNIAHGNCKPSYRVEDDEELVGKAHARETQDLWTSFGETSQLEKFLIKLPKWEICRKK